MKNKLIWIVFILGLCLILTLVRSINLLGLPLYLDEGLYIFWAKLFSESSGFAYVSLQDGKTPLFIWLISYFTQWLNNSILVARLISVVAGGITALSWMVLLNKITTKKGVLVFWGMLLIAPYAFLVERIGFVDSLLTMWGSLSMVFLYFGYLWVKEKNKFFEMIFWGILSGIFLGCGFLTKTTVLVFVVASTIVSIYWIVQFVINRELKKAAAIILGIISAVLIYREIVFFIRVGAYRFWGEIAVKEGQLAFTLTEIIKRVFNIFDSNINSIYLAHSALILQYFLVYSGIITFLFVVGAIWILKKKRSLAWLLIYIFVIVVGILLAGKVMASRYLYIVFPAFVSIASFGFLWIWSSKIKYLKILVIGGLIILSLQSIKMIIDPLHGVYTHDDKSYLLTSDLSALGLCESIEFINNRSDSIVGVSGIWGVAEGSLVVFEDFGVEAKKVDHWAKKMDEGWSVDIGAIKESSKSSKYLYLTRSTENLKILKEFENFKIVKEWSRPGSTNKTYLLQLE